jgi:Phage integrase, N-terminal SAM-like domain
VQWIVRYILFHNKRHPKDMGVSEIEKFLTHLAVEGNVAAATQNDVAGNYRDKLGSTTAGKLSKFRRTQSIPTSLFSLIRCGVLA